jgi:two-component system, chemotaxis family, chemotaxis protein CheY
MDNFMEQGFIDILKQLVAEQVNAVLTEPKQFKAVLADYTRNEYKKESRFLIQAVEAGVSKAIKEADDLPSCKKAKIHELVEDYGLSQEVSAAIVDTLALVLRGDTSKSVTATPAVEKAAAATNATPTAEKKKTEPKKAEANRGNSGTVVIEKEEIAAPPIKIPPNFNGKNKNGKPYRIFVVDDSVFVAKQMGKILTSRGMEVVATAADGAQAVEKYKELYPNIDLVTLDLIMPVMDGVTALQKILEFDKNANVFMVGSEGKESEIKKCLFMGAKSYAIKPLEPNVVLARIASIFGYS